MWDEFYNKTPQIANKLQWVIVDEHGGVIFAHFKVINVA